MNYYFGVDGGGTRSRIRLVGESDTLLYEAEGGTTNIYAGDHQRALYNLGALIFDMLAACELEPSDITAGAISSAGLDRPDEKRQFSEYIISNVSLKCPIYYCNDGESLLVGGLGGLEGISLIAGTGSLAIGRLTDGTKVRAGGFGYMLGDEGSAYWIAHQAIIRILRSIELRDLETSMLPEFLKFYHLRSSDEFVELIHHTLKKSEIASSAKIVSAAALQEDPLASDIIARCVDELFNLVESVIRRLPQLQQKQIIFSGGVLEYDELIRERLVSRITSGFPDFGVAPRKYDAVTGACMLAKQLFPVE